MGESRTRRFGGSKVSVGQHDRFQKANYREHLGRPRLLVVTLRMPMVCTIWQAMCGNGVLMPMMLISIEIQCIVIRLRVQRVYQM